MSKKARGEVEVMVSQGGRRPKLARVVGELLQLDAEGLPPLRKTAGNPGFGRREVAVEVWREVQVLLPNCLKGDRKDIKESDGSKKEQLNEVVVNTNIVARKGKGRREGH